MSKQSSTIPCHLSMFHNGCKLTYQQNVRFKTLQICCSNQVSSITLPRYFFGRLC